MPTLAEKFGNYMVITNNTGERNLQETYGDYILTVESLSGGLNAIIFIDLSIFAFKKNDNEIEYTTYSAEEVIEMFTEKKEINK